MFRKALTSVTVIGLVAACTTAAEAREVRGRVFLDTNQNGLPDFNEPGIRGVAVSNGIDVTVTDHRGRYVLPAYDEMIVFVTKPAGYKVPLSENNTPKFYYIHQPNGSPDYIEEFPGIDPTGPLPRRVDFPLYKGRYSDNFQAVIMGDTQPYTHEEVSFVRDSVVKEVAGETLARFAIAMGDNIGDELSLYPRFLKVMSGMQMPYYLVPGNHDMNLDAEDPKYAFETFKRYAGPTYYSFDYGKVHFVVLNSVSYPSPRYPDTKRYQGEISEAQMIWLENDLAFVPKDHLVVLNMHIPVVNFQDRFSTQHQVINREDLYALLDGRKALALGGHTHTLEHFLPGEELEGWGQPTPIPQIVVGAACGSWWGADYDEFGVPLSYQRDGAPRGYLLFKFEGNAYEDRFKATGKAADRQMNIAFDMPSFYAWYDRLIDWLNTDASIRPEDPPVTIDDLPDQGMIPAQDLAETTLIANVWNATSNDDVYCVFDGHSSVLGSLHRDLGDPFALRLEAYVMRYAGPWQSGRHTVASPHLFACDVPADLEAGIHRVQVFANDIHGNWHHEAKTFEVGGPY